MIMDFSNKKLARIAGLLYLVVVLTGIFSLAYVPSKLIVWDKPSTTFHNIVSSESLFRLGIVSGLICYTFFLFYPLFYTNYSNKSMKNMLNNTIWEVDEFLGNNVGLIVAEIELTSEVESFNIPAWIDKEVTGQEKYYNSNLTIAPYKNWES